MINIEKNLIVLKNNNTRVLIQWILKIIQSIQNKNILLSKPREVIYMIKDHPI